MAIKSVTAENLAEFVSGRTPSAPEPVAKEGDGPTPGNPVIKPGEAETKDAPPEPQVKEGKAKPVQPRIDELVREKKELDEAFQTEYETRLRLEGELNALKSQQQPKVEEPAPKELKAPDPKDYTDQAKYDADLKAYQDALIDARVEKKLQERSAEESKRKVDEAFQANFAKAQTSIPDFIEVIQDADRTGLRLQPPPHIQAALHQSEYGPHLGYHLLKNPSEQKRIFALPVALGLLELGKIQLQYAPKEKGETPPEAPTPETTRAPAPIAKLKDSNVQVSTDLSKPMSFTDYKRQRIEQIRGRRRH